MNMSFPKFILIGFITFLSCSLNATRQEFCDGFYQGYVEGWNRSSGSIFQPSVPLCPFEPRRTVRDPKDDYEFGYEIGYDQGTEDGRRG